jgi:Rrf2 family transcriptional regulator, nitric oxide-sensitive transcriptional repressor
LLSQTTEYALRAIVWLATTAGEPQTTDQIAKATYVPAGYLAKVMQSLGRSGLVTAQRGKHGGFCLSKAAAGMSVLEVVNAVDPLRRIHTCPLGLKSHGTVLCPLHRRLDDATLMVEKAFAETTIGELLETPSPSRPLCEIAAVQRA